jgi:hypothetical protein
MKTKEEILLRLRRYYREKFKGTPCGRDFDIYYRDDNNKLQYKTIQCKSSKLCGYCKRKTGHRIYSRLIKELTWVLEDSNEN